MLGLPLMQTQFLLVQETRLLTALLATSVVLWRPGMELSELVGWIMEVGLATLASCANEVAAVHTHENCLALHGI